MEALGAEMGLLPWQADRLSDDETMELIRGYQLREERLWDIAAWMVFYIAGSMGGLKKNVRGPQDLLKDRALYRKRLAQRPSQRPMGHDEDEA